MTPVDVRDAAARLCDEAQGRWMTLVPGETTTRGIRHERGNEASALAAAIRALPVDDAAERAARGAAWELAELRATVEVLRPIAARVVDAEAEAARRTDEVVAIGEALGLRAGATGAECVGRIGEMRATTEGRPTWPTPEEVAGEIERLRAVLSRAGRALSQAEATAAVLRGRFEASQAAHDSLCDALVAVSRGEAPGAIDGCVIAADALRAIAAERERLRTVATAARAYLAADLDVTDAYDEVARTDALRALTASLDDEVTR